MAPPRPSAWTDARGVAALDEKFHATLVAATGNAEMARIHHDLTERIRIIRRLDFTKDARIEATYNEHARILRAVLQRKADQAQLMLKSHIEASKAEVRKITLAYAAYRAGCSTPDPAGPRALTFPGKILVQFEGPADRTRPRISAAARNGAGMFFAVSPHVLWQSREVKL